MFLNEALTLLALVVVLIGTTAFLAHALRIEKRSDENARALPRQLFATNQKHS